MNKIGSTGFLARIVVCIGLADVLGATVVPASGKILGPAGLAKRLEEYRD